MAGIFGAGEVIQRASKWDAIPRGQDSDAILLRRCVIRKRVRRIIEKRRDHKNNHYLILLLKILDWNNPL